LLPEMPGMIQSRRSPRRRPVRAFALACLTILVVASPVSAAPTVLVSGGERASSGQVEAGKGKQKGRDAGRPGQRKPPAPKNEQHGAVPPTQPGDASARSAGYADPFATLGAKSPFCRRGQIGRAASENCRVSGSIAHTYPLSSYGLDVRVGFSLTKVENNLLGALQNVAALAWMGLVYLLKGVLLLLEWAFSLDLVGDALPGVGRALKTLHEQVLGEPWFLAAISIAGLWGIWRGFVQRRTIETLSGLGATVALMVAALVLIANPAGTVGYASKLANEGSLGLLSAASKGRVKQPAESFSDAMRGLFDSLAVQPWCALEFGDVDWCLARADANAGVSNADVWLSFPAQGDQRNSLYKLTKGEALESGGILGSGISFGDLTGSARDVITGGPLGPALGLAKLGREALGGRDAQLSDRIKTLVHKDPERVKMQEAGGTFPRIALLVLIAAGMLGAIGLLLYLGVRLLLASILSVILILLAPAMLLAPAFGESGRATFVAWGKRLLGALAAKLIYALLLALVLVAASMIAALDIGWFGVWLLQLAFWWGILLKRKELLGFLSAGHRASAHHAPSARRLYRDARAASFAIGSVGRRAVKVGGAPALVLGRRGFEQAEATREGTHLAAREQLEERSDQALGMQLAGARQTVARNDSLDRELRDVNRGLAKYDTRVQVAKQRGEPLPTPGTDEEALLARRGLLEGSKDTPAAIRQAASIVGTADRNLALTGREFSERDRAKLMEQRRDDIEAALAPDHERSLRFAAVDPRAYDRASPEQRAAMREQAREAIARDRELLVAVPRQGRPNPDRRAVRGAQIRLSPERLQERVREHDELRRRERRRQRQRALLYRRR
jgi:hypothetical protein